MGICSVGNLFFLTIPSVSIQGPPTLAFPFVFTWTVPQQPSYPQSPLRFLHNVSYFFLWRIYTPAFRPLPVPLHIIRSTFDRGRCAAAGIRLDRRISLARATGQ